MCLLAVKGIKMILCDSCQRKSCDKILSYNIPLCNDFIPPSLNVKVGDIVWVICNTYNLNKYRLEYEVHKCKIKLVTEPVIIAQCVPSDGFSYNFNLRTFTYAHDFFFTENECRTHCEMLNQYE